jgi:hypothetical protein
MQWSLPPQWPIPLYRKSSTQQTRASTHSSNRLNNFETARFLHAVINDRLANGPEQNVWLKLKRYQYSLFALQTFGFPVSAVRKCNGRLLMRSCSDQQGRFTGHRLHLLYVSSSTYWASTKPGYFKGASSRASRGPFPARKSSRRSPSWKSSRWL